MSHPASYAYLLACYCQAEGEIEHLQRELDHANRARREAEATIEGLGLELAEAQRTIARLVARVRVPSEAAA